MPTRGEMRRQHQGKLRRRRAVVGGGAVVLVIALSVGIAAALRGDGDQRPSLQTSPSSEATSTTLAPNTSIVAEGVVPVVDVFAAPDEPEPMVTFQNPVPRVDGDGNNYEVPLVLLVDEQQGDWLNVLLPIRPNGSTGWIHASDVALTPTTYHITVELGAHQITVYDGEEVVLQEPVGVGVDNTPTPGGRYFIKELLQTPDPNGPYGPFAYGLSGFSEVLTEFNGGPGDLGIHGTNQPEAIGTNVSSGCIRMSNEGITRLAGLLPLGTPVEIVA